MSTVLAPLALAIAGGALKLAALFGCVEACPKSARAIGAFAWHELYLFQVVVEHANARTINDKLIVIGDFLIFSIVLLPAMIAGAVAWTFIRRALRRAGSLDLVAARAPRPEDWKERQLVNAADEMALAAGLPTPRVLVIETEITNAAVAGTSHEAATVLVTFHTLGLFHTFLDLPFRWSAWRSLGRFARETFDSRVSPVDVLEAGHGIEESFSHQSMNSMSVLSIPLLPLRFVTIFQRLVLVLWCLLVLKWPLQLLWRARRYLADSCAVQLTRNSMRSHPPCRRSPRTPTSPAAAKAAAISSCAGRDAGVASTAALSHQGCSRH